LGGSFLNVNVEFARKIKAFWAKEVAAVCIVSIHGHDAYYPIEGAENGVYPLDAGFFVT